MAVPSPAASTAIITRRERLRGQTTEEIKRVAREQMAHEGTASLSLRQIAAAMGMTAPALYRYYASRDDLLTALIVDSYNAIADAVEAAVAAHHADDPARRIVAAMLAFREWSVMHPTEFALIYGSPIPGYHAPKDETNSAASRPNVVFLNLMGEAWKQGMLTLPPSQETESPVLAAQLAAWRDEHEYDVPLSFLHMLLSVWSAMYGMVALEVFGHATDVLGDASEFFRLEAQAILARLGLHIPPDDADDAIHALPSEGGIPPTDV